MVRQSEDISLVRERRYEGTAMVVREELLHLRLIRKVDERESPARGSGGAKESRQGAIRISKVGDPHQPGDRVTAMPGVGNAGTQADSRVSRDADAAKVISL